MQLHRSYLTTAAALCILAMAAMLLSLTLGRRQVQIPFSPPPFDPAACSGTPAVPEGLGWQLLDANAYQAGICGVIVPKDGRADLWLTNPAQNHVWLKVRILDAQGTVLGQSDLIKPGEYVVSVPLAPTPAPGTAVTLKIMAYEPETYYSAGAVSLSTIIE